MSYQQQGNILKLVKDDKVHNFKDYKKAKIHVEHLKAIINVVNLSIQGLEFFEIYEGVQRILFALKSEKKILQGHLVKQEEIIKNKGK